MGYHKHSRQRQEIKNKNTDIIESSRFSIFHSHNDGEHLVVCLEPDEPLSDKTNPRIDYWPTTNRWRCGGVKETIKGKKDAHDFVRWFDNHLNSLGITASGGRETGEAESEIVMTVTCPNCSAWIEVEFAQEENRWYHDHCDDCGARFKYRHPVYFQCADPDEEQES